MRWLEQLQWPPASWVSFSLGLLFFLLLGPVMVVMGRAERAEATDSLDWPSAPGKMLRSNVHVGRDSDRNKDVDLHIEYEYSVGGERFTSRRAFLGSLNDNEDVAREIVVSYPEGADVTVFYNPRQPQLATLIRGAHQPVIVDWLGACFMLLGAVGCIVACHSRWAEEWG